MIPVEIHNGLLITNYKEQPMIVDTGSPITFWDSIMIMDSKKYSKVIGKQVDGLLGLDELGKTLTLYQNSLDIGLCIRNKYPIPIKWLFGLPLFKVFVGEKEYTGVFDSGSQISYVPNSSHTKEGTVYIDNSPLIGEIATRLAKVEVSIHCQKVILNRVGYMPPMLRALTKIQNIDVILGSEVLEQFAYSLDDQYCYFSSIED